MAQSITHQQQQMLRESWMMASGSSASTSRNENRGDRETIHSGHFMVSHFEAEAQDDEDTEIEMPDPDESGATEVDPSVSSAGTCTAIVPVSRANSNSVIDISLAKLFKCMNLAYRQKLTSPKWNRFKGIRLRWKDKIRLNNLIWRCWHMQFIMKKKTLVCQFASPLDVDLHSKPEAVVLEGKYWKRQFDVIKAEYMKWRKFYRTRGLGNSSIMDTVSEIDIFDWSPCTSDKNLMGIDDYCWTADTLFSTINSPFPFPDPREIARGAGIADFIQPSLGPLQPNLDDFMNGAPLQDLINSHLSSRLAPVPEEGTDDMMFRSDYDFPAIMGTEQMDSSIIQDGSTLTDVSSMQSPSHDQMATIIQFNNSPTTMQNQSVMQFGGQTMQQVVAQTSMNTLSNAMMASSQPTQLQTQVILSPSGEVVGNFITTSTDQQQADLMSNEAKKRNIRGMRAQQIGRRVPINYDKSQPTQHQTNLYNQMLAAQQQQQGRIQGQPQSTQTQPMTVNSNASPQTSTFSTNLYLAAQQQQQEERNAQQLQSHTSPIQTTTNNYMNALNLSSSGGSFGGVVMQMDANIVSQVVQQQQQQQQTQQHSPQLKHSSSLMSLLAMKNEDSNSSMTTANVYKANAAAAGHQPNFKPYPTQQAMKSSAYGQMSPRSMRLSSPPSHQLNQQLAVASAADKELYRSKSLPLNSTLPIPIVKEETFAMPRQYQPTKSQAAKYRVRSNSMVSKHHAHNSNASLSNAASEPMLKSLAQLLTSSTASSGNCAASTSTAPIQPQQLCLSNSFGQQQQQQQSQQRAFWSSPSGLQLPSSNSNSPHGSFAGSSTISMATNQTSTPSLSPDSMPDQDSPKYSRSSIDLRGSVPSGSDSLQRRVGHIHAEQKRRYNIKNGFDMLHSLIPQLQQNPNAKLSKAAMLQKGAEYIRLLRTDRDSNKHKMDALRKERDALNNSLNHLHSVLPANGAPVARQRTSRLKELYNDYVTERTLQNWKFWILGLIFEPLLSSFNSTVSVASMDELYRTAMLWVDQNCSLIEIRPAVSDKLRYLSTTTDILSDPPSTLQEEVLKAISSNKNPTNL